MKRYEENKKKYNQLLKRKASEFEITYSLEHLNRDFIGIEQEEKYFEIAKQRIELE